MDSLISGLAQVVNIDTLVAQRNWQWHENWFNLRLGCVDPPKWVQVFIVEGKGPVRLKTFIKLIISKENLDAFNTWNVDQPW